MTSLVHEKSAISSKSELDLFTLPLTQTGVETGSWDPHHPVTSLNDEAPIQFEINGSGEKYVDLNNTNLLLQVKITKEDGTDLDASTNVGPVNNWMHSLFKSVEVELNNVSVTNLSSGYGYQAYLENLLSYQGDAKKSQLQSVMWSVDTAGHMDGSKLTTPTTPAENTGFNKRGQQTRASKLVELMGPLSVPIFNQDRLLLNGVDARIKLHRSTPAFHLMSSAAGPFKTHIHKAILYVRKVRVEAGVRLGHARPLETSTAKYPIRRGNIRTHVLPSNITSEHVQDLLKDEIPRRVIIGFVDNDAYDGSLTKNPFHFKHYNIIDLSLKVGGDILEPLRPDFSEGIYTREFLNLYSGIGKLKEDFGNDIIAKTFPRGYTLFAFDLTPDLSCESDHYQLVKKGNVDLDATFASALSSPVCMIVYVEYDNVTEIDKARNVITDF